MTELAAGVFPFAHLRNDPTAEQRHVHFKRAAGFCAVGGSKFHAAAVQPGLPNYGQLPRRGARLARGRTIAWPPFGTVADKTWRVDRRRTPGSGIGVFAIRKRF